MADYSVVSSKSRMLMVRLVMERTTKDAVLMPFGQSHEWSLENSSEQDTTKTGTVGSSGTSSEKLSWEGLALRPDSDDATDIDKMLYYAASTGAEVEVWDVDFGAKPKDGAEGKGKLYPSKYATMFLNSVTGTFGEGNGKIKYEGTSNNVSFGDATVSELNESIAKEFFYDTVKGATKTDGIAVYTPETEPGGTRKMSADNKTK